MVEARRIGAERGTLVEIIDEAHGEPRERARVTRDCVTRGIDVFEQGGYQSA